MLTAILKNTGNYIEVAEGEKPENGKTDCNLSLLLLLLPLLFLLYVCVACPWPCGCRCRGCCEWP